MSNQKKKNVLVTSFIPEKKECKLSKQLCTGFRESNHLFEEIVISNENICNGKAFDSLYYIDTFHVINTLLEKMTYSDVLAMVAQFHVEKINFTKLYSFIKYFSSLNITTMGRQNLITGHIPFDKLPGIFNILANPSDIQLKEMMDKLSSCLSVFNNKDFYAIMTIEEKAAKRQEPPFFQKIKALIDSRKINDRDIDNEWMASTLKTVYEKGRGI